MIFPTNFVELFSFVYSPSYMYIYITSELNNPELSICHKTLPTKDLSIYFHYFIDLNLSKNFCSIYYFR